ncbi:AMP-binding protein [Exilibacterium tricleocarpae]|uniref:Long-chain-fatty-acid--CoA ligase n=1 Tax=Exilibacterium tricleocarpae TaxID=2591008 RepID=A0A545TLZ7_9GAMM|nr:AMP-binding protein [Exilibacterium tricleocarpae]TQV78267.1 AMP-binding protein [Exilibacterium tricleocarpae]
MDATFWNGKRAAGVPDSLAALFENYGELTILDVFREAVQEHGQRPAYTGIGHTLTYADIDRYSAAFAHYLQTHTDLRPGDRIAIQMANLLQYPVTLFGALRAGLVVVNTNPLYTAREMLHQFKDAGVRALVFMDMFGDKVEEILPETDIDHLIVTGIADLLPAPKRWLVNGAVRYLKKMVPAFKLPAAVTFNEALKRGDGGTPQTPTVRSEDVAVLQYTGGTTGVAKGAMLTHANLVANMLQVKANLEQLDAEGRKIHEPGNEHLVAPLPLYHIYSFIAHMMVAMSTGAHNILIANPRDVGRFIDAIKPWPVTSFVGINTLFVALMNHPEFARCDFSHLKSTGSGGTALVADTAQRWKEITGVDIGEGYGLTECSPVVCGNFAADQVRHGTVGVPVVDTALKVIDADGKELPIGERGELCVKGPQVMKGYWQRPEATREVFTEDGWFRTGDVAVIDADGYVRIVDRIKDMVLVSGFNVFPNEIEDVVSMHPAVESCAAIGVPDADTGEAVRLFVVSNGEAVTAEEIIGHCREHLTGYKVPKQVVFRSDLPMSPVGKILRKDLRDEVLAEA